MALLAVSAMEAPDVMLPPPLMISVGAVMVMAPVKFNVPWLFRLPDNRDSVVEPPLLESVVPLFTTIEPELACKIALVGPFRVSVVPAKVRSFANALNDMLPAAVMLPGLVTVSPVPAGLTKDKDELAPWAVIEPLPDIFKLLVVSVLVNGKYKLPLILVVAALVVTKCVTGAIAVMPAGKDKLVNPLVGKLLLVNMSEPPLALPELLSVNV